MKFPDLFELFWNLPIYVFGKPNKTVAICALWIWRLAVTITGAFLLIASIRYNFFLASVDR